MRLDLLLSICVAAACSDAAMATEYSMAPPRPASTTDAVNAQVLHGHVVLHPEIEWPASLQFVGKTGLCSATVIGPRVVMTAAHCVDSGDTATVIIVGPSVPGHTPPVSTPTITCTDHAGYPSDITLDISLCWSASDIYLALPAAVYETISTTPQRPAIGDTVTLQGYGCIQELPGGPRGALFVGLTKVVDDVPPEGYIRTLDGAAVCFGDSGGGAFFDLNSRQRRVIGINSRGNIHDRSYLTAVARPEIHDFIASWRLAHHVLVCGLDAGLLSCHG